MKCATGSHAQMKRLDHFGNDHADRVGRHREHHEHHECERFDDEDIGTWLIDGHLSFSVQSVESLFNAHSCGMASLIS